MLVLLEQSLEGALGNPAVFAGVAEDGTLDTWIIWQRLDPSVNSS